MAAETLAWPTSRLSWHSHSRNLTSRCVKARMGNISWRSQGSSEDPDSLQGDLEEDTGTNSLYIAGRTWNGMLCHVALEH